MASREVGIEGAHSWHVCRQRRPVIEQVAAELCHPVGPLEQVDGHRIVELLETTPLAPVQPDPDAPESAAASSTPQKSVRDPPYAENNRWYWNQKWDGRNPWS